MADRHVVARAIEHKLWTASRPLAVEELIELLRRGGFDVSLAELVSTLEGTARFKRIGNGWRPVTKPGQLDTVINRGVLILENSHRSTDAHRLVDDAAERTGLTLDGPSRAAAVSALRDDPRIRVLRDNVIGLTVRRSLPERLDLKRRPLYTPSTTRLMQSGVFTEFSSWKEVRQRLSRTLAHPTLHEIRLTITGDVGAQVVSATPVEMSGRTGLAAWLAVANPGSARELSAVGWWLWQVGDPKTLLEPARLTYREDLHQYDARPAVFSAHSGDAGELICLTAERWSNKELKRCRIDVYFHRRLPGEEVALSRLRGRIKNLRPVRGRCRECDRPLRAPESVTRGVGPCCWAKLHEEFGDGDFIIRALDEFENEGNYWIRPLPHRKWVKRIAATA